MQQRMAFKVERKGHGQWEKPMSGKDKWVLYAGPSY